MSAAEDPVDVETLVSAIVAGTGDNRVTTLQRVLGSRELYVRLTVDEEGRHLFVTSAVPQVDALLQVFTSRSRPDIMYGGMTWDAIVDAIGKSPDLNGIQLINDSDDWVVITRYDLRHLA